MCWLWRWRMRGRRSSKIAICRQCITNTGIHRNTKRSTRLGGSHWGVWDKGAIIWSAMRRRGKNKNRLLLLVLLYSFHPSSY
ncbi:hypothetical protein LY78DRAFT_14927 [Colletotrichum sublineola]|nr:hypothetical protein LY78DRAFT_14927 [Colletotrichum sublineola]